MNLIIYINKRCIFVFVESDRDRFESQTLTSPTRSQVQLPKGMENTFTRGRYTPSGNIYVTCMLSLICILMNNFFFIRMQLNIMYNIWVTCKITLYTLLLLIAIYIIVIFLKCMVWRFSENTRQYIIYVGMGLYKIWVLFRHVYCIYRKSTNMRSSLVNFTVLWMKSRVQQSAIGCLRKNSIGT